MRMSSSVPKIRLQWFNGIQPCYTKCHGIINYHKWSEPPFYVSWEVRDHWQEGRNKTIMKKLDSLLRILFGVNGQINSFRGFPDLISSSTEWSCKYHYFCHRHKSACLKMARWCCKYLFLMWLLRDMCCVYWQNIFLSAEQKQHGQTAYYSVLNTIKRISS